MGVQEGMSTIRHTRKIDDRQYTVVEKKEKGQITSTDFDTLMTPEEFSAFQGKWKIMWHPEMSEDQILDLVHEEELTTDTETKSRMEPEHRKHEKKKKRF